MVMLLIAIEHMCEAAEDCFYVLGGRVNACEAALFALCQHLLRRFGSNKGFARLAPLMV